MPLPHYTYIQYKYVIIEMRRRKIKKIFNIS